MQVNLEAYFAGLLDVWSCDSCGCLLPANPHSDSRNLTHSKVEQGYTTSDLVASTKTRVGPNSVARARSNIRKTVKLINSGKLSPSKRK